MSSIIGFERSSLLRTETPSGLLPSLLSLNWDQFLDLWESPRCKADLKLPGLLIGTARSTVCGDIIDIGLNIVDGEVMAAYWNGHGCVQCLGMAELLCRHKQLLKVVVEFQPRKSCILVPYRAWSSALGRPNN